MHVHRFLEILHPLPIGFLFFPKHELREISPLNQASFELVFRVDSYPGECKEADCEL